MQRAKIHPALAHDNKVVLVLHPSAPHNAGMTAEPGDTSAHTCRRTHVRQSSFGQPPQTAHGKDTSIVPATASPETARATAALLRKRTDCITRKQGLVDCDICALQVLALLQTHWTEPL